VKWGIDLASVQSLLRHSKLESTARYAPPVARDLEQAVGELVEDD
jgi:site-specific recombinase XerD